MPPGDTVIMIKGLVRRFKKVRALQGIDLAIEKGEIFGVVGPDGAGKTTLLQSICAILDPTEGTITVEGSDTVRNAHTITSRIGYMSQRFSLYLDLTVGENIDFFGGVYGTRRDTLAGRKHWVIEMAGLSGKERILASDLSGALRQRLALGCALLHHPDVVFLDEPTSGVDPVSRKAFWEMIKTVAGAGTTVFVTTHYLGEAENCDRVALLHRGRLLAAEAPQKLKTLHGAKTMEELFVQLVEHADENAKRTH